MGQYYKIINLDKKEYLSSWNYNCGAKLMEFSYIGNDLTSNDFAGALISLIESSWKNDRIIVVGDYFNMEFVREETPKMVDFFSSLYNELGLDEESPFYNCCERKDFKELKNIKSKKAKRYLVNNKTMQYVDLKNLPVEWTYEKDDLTSGYTSIFPLTLLIAVGNGLGLGDYGTINKNLVGYWCNSSEFIEFSSKIPKGFEKFSPNFTEKEFCEFAKDVHIKRQNIERNTNNIFNLLGVDINKCQYITDMGSLIDALPDEVLKKINNGANQQKLRNLVIDKLEEKEISVGSYEIDNIVDKVEKNLPDLIDLFVKINYPAYS